MGYVLDSQGRRIDDRLGGFLVDENGAPPNTAPRDWTSSKVPALAARALQKHGLGIVPNGARQASGQTLTQSELVERVISNLGIPVPLSARPRDDTGTVDDAEIVRRALLSFGVNPTDGAPSGTEINQVEIADRALRTHGINPADLPSESWGRTFTVSEVAAAALRQLSVVDAREIPNPADQAEAELHAVNTHEMLAKLDYVDWNQDAIPAGVFEAYVALTANVTGPSFGVKKGDAAAAIEMVRQQSLSGSIAQLRAIARVTTVHDALAAEGLADWTEWHIPASVAEAYVALVSIAIAPIYGKPQDQQARTEAMGQVRRVVLSGARARALARPKVASAHDTFVRAGVADWQIIAIPAAFAEDYAAVVAAMLAPTYGQQRPDPTEAVVERMRKAGLLLQTEKRARERVAAVNEELNALGVVTWSGDQIPLAMGDAIATAATALMKDDPAALEVGFRRVRRIAMAGPYGQQVAERYVRSVHYELEASGKTRWSLLDIPRWAEEPYVLLAATALATDLEVDAKPEWALMAMRSLLVNTVLPSTGEPVRGVYF